MIIIIPNEKHRVVRYRLERRNEMEQSFRGFNACTRTHTDLHHLFLKKMYKLIYRNVKTLINKVLKSVLKINFQKSEKQETRIILQSFLICFQNKNTISLFFFLIVLTELSKVFGELNLCRVYIIDLMTRL